MFRLRDGRAFKNKSMTYENRVAKYVITETTENSAGTYFCQARNDAGSAETSCQLKIQGMYITNFKLYGFTLLSFLYTNFQSF